jgi:hypothetical protein
MLKENMIKEIQDLMTMGVSVNQAKFGLVDAYATNYSLNGVIVR